MSNKPQVKIVNALTGKEIVRDANAEELAQMELDAAETTRIKLDEAAKAAEKAALLNRLGMTAEEARLLLSQNNL